MKSFFQWLASLFGKNHSFTPKAVILDQMNEPRPLPMGRVDFMVWSDRILAGCLIPHDSDQPMEVHVDSIRYALANMLIQLGPTESHKPDAYFIHSLRKFAINQVADVLRKELYEAGKNRAAAKEAAAQGQNGRNSEHDKLENKDAQVLEFRGKEGDNG